MYNNGIHLPSTLEKGKLPCLKSEIPLRTKAVAVKGIVLMFRVYVDIIQ